MSGKSLGNLAFGTAGVPVSSPRSDTLSGIRRIRELGLDAMEIEFVQGVRMSPETAEKVRQVAFECNVRLMIHAPYYVNLNAKERDKLQASKERILDSARIGAICGAESVTFHPAFMMGDSSETVYARVKENLEQILETLEKEGITIRISPETTGKPSQFGSLDELVRLAKEIKKLGIAVDFAHLHARDGKFNTYEEISVALSKLKKELGSKALANMHIHFSGIEYGPKGERNHLNLSQSDMNYREHLRALRDFGVSGVVICESPNLEGDAILLQREFARILK